MEGMEEKLGSILNNPQMMQQIMSMAQSLNTSQGPPQPDPPTPAPAIPDFDPALLQKVIGVVGQMGVDNHQQALLCALRPYLTDGRIQKLEKAMRAAKLATVASSAFNSGALSFLMGR